MDTLKTLGYPEGSKLLIIHADDAGLSHSENLATIQALKAGQVNSYSIMTTCPWFEEIANFAIENPDIDYGIHLTLTCEWKNYKWGPISSKSEVPGLVNKNGVFFNNRNDFKNNASVEEIKKELQAQIDKAYDYGLNPTHLDSHMYTLGLKEEFLAAYKELGAAYKLPILLNKPFIESGGLNIHQCLSEKDFCVDNVILGNFEAFQNNELYNFYASALDTLPGGLNIILIHPAYDDQEMQGITTEHPNFGSQWRLTDFDFFTSEECKSKIMANGIKMITWKEIGKILYPET